MSSAPDINCCRCNSLIRFQLICGCCGDTYVGIKCMCRSYGYTDFEETGYFGALAKAKEWSTISTNDEYYCKYKEQQINIQNCKVCLFFDINAKNNQCIVNSLHSNKIINFNNKPFISYTTYENTKESIFIKTIDFLKEKYNWYLN